jgi:hypothetical protein
MAASHRRGGQHVLQTKAMARSHRLGGQHGYSEDTNKGKKKPPSLSVYAYQR